MINPDERAIEASTEPLKRLELEIISCRKCPRLVEFREGVARAKKKQFLDWDYWGKPVPGFGDPRADLLIVGLAPAPHGGNRTGRVFTGDKSADFLVRELYKAGFVNQPTSRSRDDGLKLNRAYITAAVKCAPPENKPTNREASNCSTYLEQELNLLTGLTAILCLGQFAYNHVTSLLGSKFQSQPSIPKFKHGLELDLGLGGPTVFASYHPSPRNTQTGKLSPRTFQSVLSHIRKRLNQPVLR